MIELIEQKDRFWVTKKSRPTQFESNKNRPGTDYAPKGEERTVDETQGTLGAGSEPPSAS